MRFSAPALVAALVLAAGPVLGAAAPNDGFAAFWTTFTAALAKNDRVAAEAMMKPSMLGDGPGAPKTLDQYYVRNFGARTRSCLVKQRPHRDTSGSDVSYSAFCGELIYVFSKVGGAWKFTDLSAND